MTPGLYHAGGETVGARLSSELAKRARREALVAAREAEESARTTGLPDYAVGRTARHAFQETFERLVNRQLSASLVTFHYEKATDEAVEASSVALHEDVTQVPVAFTRDPRVLLREAILAHERAGVLFRELGIELVELTNRGKSGVLRSMTARERDGRARDWGQPAVSEAIGDPGETAGND